jgi:hypothetical protein
MGRNAGVRGRASRWWRSGWRRAVVVEGGNTGYSAYVETGKQRTRWDLSMRIAWVLEKRETGSGETMVWSATWSIFKSDMSSEDLASHPYLQCD